MLVMVETQDDGFHEIQLNGKQLVFLFMAATVVSVVIFLCGVLVGTQGVGTGPTSLDLVTGLVDRASIGACVQVDAYDTSRLMHDVEYRDVGTATMATTYVVPTPL